jgi:hypothetical protein
MLYWSYVLCCFVGGSVVKEHCVHLQDLAGIMNVKVVCLLYNVGTLLPAFLCH